MTGRQQAPHRSFPKSACRYYTTCVDTTFMEKPLCKLCGKKHWSRDGCSASGKVPDLTEKPKPKEGSVAQSVEQRPFKPRVAGSTPARSTKSDKPDKPENPPKDDNPWPKDEPGGVVVGYDFEAARRCPECAMRRAKKAAAMKRWREKKRG